MPARPSSIPSPATQMRVALAHHRQLGLGFELAWKRGLERMKWPEQKAPRDEWKRSLSECKPIWKAAYNREGEAPRGVAELTSFFVVQESEHFPTELVA